MLADTVYVKFENMTIPVPKGYDNYLKIMYGNYMEIPDISERETHEIKAFWKIDDEVKECKQ